METNNVLLKLSEKMGLRGLEDECIVLEDERADDIYGGKFICFGNYNNCSFESEAKNGTLVCF